MKLNLIDCGVLKKFSRHDGDHACKPTLCYGIGSENKSKTNIHFGLFILNPKSTQNGSCED